MMKLFFLLSCFPTLAQAEKVYRFGIMPKSTSNSFFFPVRDGCEARARIQGDVICDWVGPEDEDPTGQAQVDIVNELVDMRLNGTLVYDGLAISVINGPALQEPIDRALKAGMSVICFDSDAEMTNRQAYVGTDNVAFGEQLGKVLLQVRPEGGEFAMMTLPFRNLEQRVKGIRNVLQGTTWVELQDSLITVEAEEIAQLKAKNPQLKAIMPTYGRAMKNSSQWLPFVDSNPDLTFVVADALSYQVDLMNKGYVNGLVGQLPYEVSAIVEG